MVSVSPDRRFPACRTCGVTAREYSYMKDQAAIGTKKADVQADVTQDVVDWTSAEVTTDTSKDGNVAAPTITAGNWKGTFNFNIALADAE